MSDTRREHWETVYSTKAPHEVSWYQPSPTPSLVALERIGAGPQNSLIDVGAGAGTLVATLARRGWSDLAALDISQAALDAARAAAGEHADAIDWIAADITDWQPPRRFDIWHDRAVFHFLTGEAERARYRAALAQGLAPGGHVVIATFAPDGPEKCSGLAVRRYDAQGLARELGDDFALVADWTESHATPWDAAQVFQWCVLRRH